MKDLGFFMGFFAVLIFLALTVGQEGDSNGLFFDAGESASSEADGGLYSDLIYANPGETDSYDSDTNNSSSPTSQADIEEEIAQIYEDLETLEEEARGVKLRSPQSPYAGKLFLRTGNVSETVPKYEHLLLEASEENTSGITISGWKIESYVSDEEAIIPKGDRVLEDPYKPIKESIVLLPGETAYLVTGDTFLNISFRENICTGYLDERGTIYPSLGTSCPAPIDEMEASGEIGRGNDDCYDFVETIGVCETPSKKVVDDTPRLGGTCRDFVLETLNHDDCVRLHKNDPLFTEEGYWLIYLEESTDLWRDEREIIRLLDTEGRVVDVIEY
jgi:hypothetical protein